MRGTRVLYKYASNLYIDKKNVFISIKLVRGGGGGDEEGRND